MAISQYDAGTLVEIDGTFKDKNGVLTDPGAVTYGVLKPDGTKLSGTATRASTGLYSATVDTTGGPQGVWSYEFTGTSPLQAVGDNQFYVKVLGY